MPEPTPEERNRMVQDALKHSGIKEPVVDQGQQIMDRLNEITINITKELDKDPMNRFLPKPQLANKIGRMLVGPTDKFDQDELQFLLITIHGYSMSRNY